MNTEPDAASRREPENGRHDAEGASPEGVSTNGESLPDGEPRAAASPPELPTTDGPGTEPEGKHGPTVRKPRPTTVVELIEYAYGESGRKLNLAKRDLRELVLRPETADSEMELLRKLASGDHLLAVPPRILFALAELGAERAVRERILKLVLAALVTHPVFAPLAVSLDDPAATPPLSAGRVSDAARKLTLVDLGLNATGFKETAQERLRVNAVTSFALFRVLRDGWTLEEFITEMASAVWTAPPPTRARVAEDAAGLASAHDRDTLGLVVRHFEGQIRLAEDQTRQARHGATREQRRAESAEEQNRRLTELLEAEHTSTRELSARVADLTRDLEAERTRRVVDQSHMVDDYEGLRTQVIRGLSSQIELLGDGLHALRNGSTGVAEEFLDRSLTAMQAEVNRLKDVGGGTK